MLSSGQDPGMEQCLGPGALCLRPLQVAVPGLGRGGTGMPRPFSHPLPSMAGPATLRTAQTPFFQPEAP